MPQCDAISTGIAQDSETQRASSRVRVGGGGELPPSYVNVRRGGVHHILGVSGMFSLTWFYGLKKELAFTP